MAIIEDQLTKTDDSTITLSRVEYDAIKAIADSASSNKLFYIRIKPEDYEALAKGERVVSVVQEEYRNYILVLGSSTDPMPDDEYWQTLLVEHGKIISE